MDIKMIEKYGFVYIWFDKKHKRYYVGCHWGTETDSYICSSNWMRDAYKRRPTDFKRRIIKRHLSRSEMYEEEQLYFDMIKPEEIKIRYYNLNLNNFKPWHVYPENIKTIGQKISYSKGGKSTGPCSPEKAAKISKSNKGRVFSEEHKQKLSDKKVGTTHTEEWKQENSIRTKEQWASGVRKAKEHISEEHKQKISTKLKGRKLEKDQIEFLKINSNKQYLIKYFDGKEEIINGLKKFGLDNNIPYVTLSKASQENRSIKKYNIENIRLI